MTNFADQILADLISQLEAYNPIDTSELAATLHRINLASNASRQLETALLSYTFNSPQEEITFFKTQKPCVDGRLIYYLRLLDILYNAASITAADKASYYRSEVTRLRTFYQRHPETYRYYKLGFEHLDNINFRKTEKDLVHDLDDYTILVDKRFNAPNSYLYGCFYAYELLQAYLDEKIWASTATLATPAGIDGKHALKWTGSLAALTELIYALNEMGVLSHTKHEIGILADFFSKVFDINLGNIYKTHENNRLRKKNRTPFLDQCKMALLRKFDHDDEHAL